MNDDARFERLFEDGLHELAPRRAPDRLRTTIKAETSEARPRARWIALIKEPPMRTNSRLAVGSPTVRVAAIMAATLLATLLIVSAGIAGAKLMAADGPIVVDQSGGGDYTTIGEAVASAEDGDEIVVRPGTYVETVVIDKDIALQGDGPIEDIVVTAPEGGPTIEIEDGGYYDDPYAILLQDSSATLSGLTFHGQPSEVIASGGVPTLEGLVFDHTGYAFDGSTASPAGSSIVINRASTATVRGNTITGGGPIGVFDGSDPVIEGNTLTGGPHIYLANFGTDTVIVGNTITGTHQWAIGSFHRDGHVRIEGNVIDQPGSMGINLSSGSADIIENQINRAALAGILTGQQSATVVGNQLADNRIGIVFTAGEGEVTDNTVRGGLLGISLATDAAVSGNDVEGASRTGFTITTGTPTLRENRSCGNGANLRVADAASPDIDDSNEICEDGAGA